MQLLDSGEPPSIPSPESHFLMPNTDLTDNEGARPLLYSLSVSEKELLEFELRREEKKRNGVTTGEKGIVES